MVHVWIQPVYGMHPKMYFVTVDGQPVDTLYQKSGPWLTRDQMNDICEGYREWYNHQ